MSQGSVVKGTAKHGCVQFFSLNKVYGLFGPLEISCPLFGFNASDGHLLNV